MGASLLAAVATGIHLGESAVSMINPVYYEGPALHPRERGAAIDESMLSAARPAAPQLYGWEQGYAQRAADCGGDCGAPAARDAQAYSAEVPYFGGHERPAEPDGYPAGAAEVRVVRGSDLGETGEAPKRRVDRIERYASAPLGYEEAAFSAPLSEEKPVEGEDVFHY
ncbi:MAG: hypothetical protein ACXWUN_11125 [Allosphingosinicella sp.]